MGYKAKIAKTVLSEWGETLGNKLFGKNIPSNVKPILGAGPNSISKMDALTFSNAIDLDDEIASPLTQLFKNAGDGDDDAFGLLANAARDFQVEDQGLRVLERTRKNISNSQNKQILPPQNKNNRIPRSEAHRAHKAKGKEGARSLIAGNPNTIIKKEPHNIEKAKEWARGAYAYAQQGKSGNKAQPLRGYPRYVAEDGTLYKPRPNVGRKGGYQLKFQSMDLLKGYDELRKMREAPWRKQEVIDQLQDILNRKGKGDQLDNLLKIMLKDYNTKLKGIKTAGQTKGHFISLDKGGLDIAENFGPQKGKSTKNLKTGEWEMGNYAEQADSAIPEGVSVPTTWEEYVDLKLPLLK